MPLEVDGKDNFTASFAPRDSVCRLIYGASLPSMTSLTAVLRIDTVETICSLVQAIHQQAADISAAMVKSGPGCASSSVEPPDAIDIDSKFRKHLAVPVLDSGLPSKILVP